MGEAPPFPNIVRLLFKLMHLLTTIYRSHHHHTCFEATRRSTSSLSCRDSVFRCEGEGSALISMSKHVFDVKGRAEPSPLRQNRRDSEASSGKGLLYLGYTWVDLVLSRL